jgi:hypothetical protein
MSKLSEALRAARIVNTHGMLLRFGGQSDVAILYHPTENGRGGRYARAQIYSPHFKTDPQSHWMDNGYKTFSGSRDKSIPEAMDWVARQYGITEWLPDPTDRSNLVPAHVRKAAEEFVKANRAA